MNNATKLSGKETKNELVDMIKSKDSYIRELEKKTSTPESESAKAKVLESIKATAAAVQTGVFSEEVKKNYQDMMTTIEAKEARIQELYGVEAALATMSTIKATQKQVEADNKEKLAALKADYEENTKAIIDEFAAKQEALERQYRESAKLFKDNQNREREEAAYELEKTLREEKDAAKFRTTREIREMEEQISAAQAKLDDINEKITSEEKLYERMMNIDEEIEAVKAEAFAAGEKAAEKDCMFAKKAIESNASHKAELLEKDIEALREKNAALSNDNRNLSDKLDKAYDQMRDMANNSVQANRPIMTGVTDTTKK